MPTGKVSRVALVFIVGAVALAACGGDDDDNAAPTATSAPIATATPTVERSLPASPVAVSGRPVAANPAASPPVASPIAGDAAGATVVLTEYRINVFQQSFQIGQPYTFVVQNNGSQTHEFVIEAKGAANQPLQQDGRRAEILEVPAGGIATLIWTFSEPGEYQIACHRDGHDDKGMVQEIIVEGAR